MLRVAPHVAALCEVLDYVTAEARRLDDWGALLARRLSDGHRLLVCGNGGSAAQAQHLAAELVGRVSQGDPGAFSVIALSGDSAAVTAIGNDFGFDRVFAMQVSAHGRRDDVLLALSTSGAAANALAAVDVARAAGMKTLALTGAAPNPLAAHCDDAFCVPSTATTTSQEAHLVCLHLLCSAIEGRLAAHASR